jgi:AraC-like DNA-binding protein
LGQANLSPGQCERPPAFSTPRPGGNVSRHINTWRIEHACRLMVAGQSVTAAMLGSGFNTKSNFNRESLRVTGLSPRDWMKNNPAPPDDVTKAG